MARRSVRCSACGKDLPLRKKGPPSRCPTCGARQEAETDPLMRRGKGQRNRFGVVQFVGAGCGALGGLILGIMMARMIFDDKEPTAALLWTILYALGATLMGGVIGAMSAVLWTHRE